MSSLHAARALLVVHAVLGFATVAASTHFAIHALPRRHDRRTRLFGVIAATVAFAQWTLGATLYPVFRLQVRSWLDLHAPQAVAVFEFKEHAALLAVALLAAAAFLARDDADRAPKWLLPAFGVMGALATWGAALGGTWVTAIRAIGAAP